MLSMLNTIFPYEMAMPAACAEERDKRENLSKIQCNGTNSWNTFAFNEIIAAIIITRGLLFMHTVIGCRLA